MPNLVGIGLSQVPTNSMLGGLAYQDPEHASIKDLDLKNLSQINSEINDAADSIFVYDTRKDSDGGAWRKRTQHTSWYNETLNTRFRGSRREFPAVAVIVGHDWGIMIYDGDDPDLPLWAYYKYLSWDRDVNSIAARDGKICFTIHTNNNYSGNGLGILDFVKDRQSRNYIGNYANFKNGFTNDLIASKREHTDYLQVGSNIREFTLLNYNAHAVALTVLPNAPVDSATGLPVPTIAVAVGQPGAANGGVSVIKDDGFVAAIRAGAGAGGYASYNVAFGSNNELIHTQAYNRSYASVNIFDAIPATGISASNSYSTARSYLYINSVPDIRGGVNGASTPNLEYVSKSSNGDIAFGFQNTDAKLTLLSEPEGAGTDNQYSSVAYITSDYNTGWMQGHIEGAFLSDTDTTNAIEYVQNGYFNSDVSSWTIGSTGTTATLNANRLLITAPTSGASWGYVYQGITTEIGKTYKISLHYDRGNVDGRINVRNDSTNTVSGALFYADLGTSNDGKTYWNTFTATATTTYILLYAKSTSGGTSAYDAVSVTLEKDRSVNKKGLNVLGTVIKSAVATGADLMSYSNFSASNHLRQPPNSDMNIGTGDAYEMIWYQTTNTSGTMMMISYEGGAIGTNDYGKPFNIRYENGRVRGWASHNGFSTHDDVLHGVSTADGNWHHAAWVKRGKEFELYVDGEFIGSDTGSVGSNALSDANSELVIGARKRGKVFGDSEEPWNNGYLALARIGKSAPTAEQIKKMYNDEKHLFRENAKATLYGSSDAVTALAHDDSNNVLHVGTSAGRSEFQGLRRINNTTEAVTTAISASNGLVAEQ